MPLRAFISATLYEVDVGAYHKLVSEAHDGNGSPKATAIATYAPPQPTLTLEPQLPDQDVYEVRIYDSRRHRRLVAAIEIVSPSNKDRHENRLSFASKIATLLKNGICVSMVDVVSTYDFNLYAELLEFVHGTDPALPQDPPAMYAATIRTRYEDRRRLMDNWYHPLTVGTPCRRSPSGSRKTWQSRSISNRATKKPVAHFESADHYNTSMRKTARPSPTYVQPYRYPSPNIPSAAIRRFRAASLSASIRVRSSSLVRMPTGNRTPKATSICSSSCRRRMW